MKFTCSVVINQPKEKVAAFFADPKYLSHYQDGFIKKELVSGTEGQNGSISKMYYKMGKGEMLLTETILDNSLPDSFFSKYHHKHTDNTMKCTFTAIDENTTRYESEIDYTAFRGFMIKVMATLFPGFFKKQVQKWLNNFKTFVEQQE